MREIKFRAWVKPLKKWADDLNVEFTSYGIPPRYSAMRHEDAGWWGNENLIIEQYTGLKDKNGVEIYEGDIVTVVGAILTSGRVVTWDCAEYMLDPEYEPAGLAELWLSQRLEVIGNIHQDLQLLHVRSEKDEP